MSSNGDTTILIRRLADGDRAAADALFPAVYEELHRLAARELSHERLGHTLQPTALVHEAFIRLIGNMPEGCRDQTQFMGLAARVIRRVLIDHARRRLAAKRGGGRTGVPVEDVEYEFSDAGLIDLDEEWARLSREAEKLLTDLEGVKKKLRNQDFLAKAKPEVVEKEKARLSQLEETLDKLKRAQESLSVKRD